MGDNFCGAGIEMERGSFAAVLLPEALLQEFNTTTASKMSVRLLNMLFIMVLSVGFIVSNKLHFLMLKMKACSVMIGWYL